MRSRGIICSAIRVSYTCTRICLWIGDPSNIVACGAWTCEVDYYYPENDDCVDEEGGSGGTSYSNQTILEEEEEDDDKIFNELTGKAKCVYEKLKKLSTGFKNAIQKFDGEFPVAHLKFSIDNNLPNSTNAVTNNSGQHLIEISFNGNTMNQRTILGLVRTFAHETIHAELFRKVRSVNSQISINDFPGIYDYYRRYIKNWQHQQMAAHYRETIADILKEFDGNQHSNQFYMDLAWEGLHGTVAWNNLSNFERTRITKVVKNYKSTGNKNCN